MWMVLKSERGERKGGREGAGSGKGRGGSTNTYHRCTLSVSAETPPLGYLVVVSRICSTPVVRILAKWLKDAITVRRCDVAPLSARLFVALSSLLFSSLSVERGFCCSSRPARVDVRLEWRVCVCVLQRRSLDRSWREQFNRSSCSITVLKSLCMSRRRSSPSDVIEVEVEVEIEIEIEQLVCNVLTMRCHCGLCIGKHNVPAIDACFRAYVGTNEKLLLWCPGQSKRDEGSLNNTTCMVWYRRRGPHRTVRYRTAA